METTINERVKLISEKYFKGNTSAMARAISVKQSTLRDIIGERQSAPSYETLKAIVDYATININSDWLMLGKGDMEIKPTGQGNAKLVENIQYMEVPVIHIHARCGYLAGYGDPEYIDSLPTMPVIVDKTYNGNYRVFETEGDSMDDGSRKAIYEGDKVLCREVKRDLWQYKLHYNDWYFAIVDKKEGIVIKQIIDHDVENGIITCHSLNPLFNDYTIQLDDVAELYNVIKIVERSARL